MLYPTVLIAEDSRDTRIMLKRAFELKGYSVIEAKTATKRSSSRKAPSQLAGGSI
jgi:DNA-binding response OmpR family regulator